MLGRGDLDALRPLEVHVARHGVDARVDPVLVEQGQAERVVRQHDTGHLGDAPEDLADVECRPERAKQRRERLEPREQHGIACRAALVHEHAPV